MQKKKKKSAEGPCSAVLADALFTGKEAENEGGVLNGGVEVFIAATAAHCGPFSGSILLRLLFILKETGVNCGYGCE